MTRESKSTRTSRTSPGWVILAAALLVVVNCRRKKEYKLPLLKTHTSQLKHTTFAAHLHEEIRPGQNLIYCATFQLAWNELMALVREPVRLDPMTALVRGLNRGDFKKGDVDPKSVTVSVNRSRENNRIRISTTLKKNLLFAQPFTRLPKSAGFKTADGVVPILGFGFEEKDRKVRARQMRQVKVIHYKDPATFVVSLQTKSPADLMVLARIKPGKTLMETYRRADDLVRGAEGKGGHLKDGDGLTVPFFNFKLEHDFETLLKQVIQNQRYRGWFIEKAHQMVRLRLDEKGALLYSESKLDIACSAGPSHKRNFDFNAPFLLYMRQKKSKAPYLVIWVGHPEILVRASDK